MQSRTLRIGLVSFPYAGNGQFSSEHPSLRPWFAKTAKFIDNDPRFQSYPSGNKIWSKDFCDTPIPMTRNAAVGAAKADGVDVLVMFDNDQIPDLYVGYVPEAKPFFQSSFDFLYQHWDKGPCVIFAPYCGAPPHPITGGEENVYVFHWDLNRNNWEKGLTRLTQFTRREASQCSGFMEVAAGPTGLIMIDMRVFDHPDLVLPWFEYEWEGDGARCPHCNQSKPGYRMQKATTEDVFFTRNCFLAGIPVYCNWDSWAGHVKPEIVGKPWGATTNQFHEQFIKKARRADIPGQKMIELNVGKSVEEVLASFGSNVVVERPADYVDPSIALDGDKAKLKVTPLKLADIQPGERLEFPSGAAAMRGKAPEEIPGWFDFQDIYKEQVDRVDDYAHFVEIGGYLGKSACFMAEQIRTKRKNVFFEVIDPWDGATAMPQAPATHPGQPCLPTNFFPLFWQNVTERGLGPYITARKTTSQRYLETWADVSLDFVMIDGDHRYKAALADMVGYWPKVKPGGVLAGHDVSYPEVAGALNEFEKTIGRKAVIRGDCFVFIKPEEA